MKNQLMLIMVALMLVVSVGFASAVSSTIISGEVYNSANTSTAGGVAGATVYVTCNGVTNSTTTFSDGTYSIAFSPNVETGCIPGMTASAYASKNGVNSSVETGVIQDYSSSINLYLGFINLVLVPEFGVFTGILTLLGAFGIFFLVKKK